MITSSTIYWLTRLPYFYGTSIFFFILFLILLFVLLCGSETYLKSIGNEEEKKKEEKELKIKARYLCVLILFSLVGICLIPHNMKEIAAIYLIPKIDNNQEINKLPTNTAKMLNTKLQGWIDDNLKVAKKND